LDGCISEDRIVVRIADANRRTWKRIRNRAADCERGRGPKDEPFQAMLPAGAPIGICNPRLVRDKERTANQQERPKRSQRNIVLQKNVAPTDLAQQFHRARPANDGKRKLAVPRRLGDNADFMALPDELPR
jgi:hypothetical protein